MEVATAEDRQALIDRLADNWKPSEIRDLGGTLLRLADSLDQHWDQTAVKSIFRWPNELSKIERNAVNLAIKARVIYAQREKRRTFIKDDLLGEPAWDMLLDLFTQFAGGAKVSVTSLCLASRVPPTTALRYITLLEDAMMIKKESSEFDKRVTFVKLTDLGVITMGRYLESY